MLNFIKVSRQDFNDRLSIVLYYSILIYIISIFIKDAPVVTNILMFVISFISILNYLLNRKHLKVSINYIIIGVLFFYAIHLLSFFFSDNKGYGLTVLVLRLPIFVLPFTFLFIHFKDIVWQKILSFLAIITVLASIVGFTNGFILSILKKNWEFIYNDNITSYLMGKQAVYFSFYVSISILIIIYLLKQKNEWMIKHKTFAYFSIIWLIFIAYMLACKSSMISLLIIFSFLFYTGLLKKKKYFEITIVIISIAVFSVLAVKLFPKTLNRFKGIANTTFHYGNKNAENHFNSEYDVNKWTSTNTRVALWSCGWDIFKNNFFFGIGIGDKHDELLNIYKKNNFYYALKTDKNTHNQYIDVALSMGIFGLLIFVWTFAIYPMFKLASQKNYFAFGIFLILTIGLFTENMLDRYQGEIMIALILPLVAKLGEHTKEKGAY